MCRCVCLHFSQTLTHENTAWSRQRYIDSVITYWINNACRHIPNQLHIEHGRATSGPRARSGPRRPSVRPATLLGNNIAIWPAKPQLVLSSVLSLRAWAFRPVRRRIEDVRQHSRLAEDPHLDPRCFSLALDESTDTKDTVQLAIFIRGVTADLNVCEEFLQLVPLRTFAKFGGWVEEPCCPVCVTCRRRSPPFVVQRIFPTLISSSTRDGSLA